MKTEKRTYRVGQRFMLCPDKGMTWAHPEKHKYILARTDMNPSFAGLINLDCGNLWSDPIMVNEATEVTNKELYRIIGQTNWKYFKLLK